MSDQPADPTQIGTPPEFSELLRAARTGDVESLQTLLRDWRPLLRHQAHGMVGTRIAVRSDSSDLVQNALTRVFLKIHQFRGETKAEWICWLRRILDREAGRSRRKHLATQRSVRRETLATAETAHEQDPLAVCSDRETQLRLYEAVQRLPVAMQEVVVRRVFEQQSFETIAADLGKSGGATRVTWTRAIRKLRDYLRNSLPPERHAEWDSTSESETDEPQR